MTNPPFNEGDAQPNEPQYGQRDPNRQQQWGHPAPAYGSQPGSKYGTAPYDPNAFGGPVQEPKEYGLLMKLLYGVFGIYLINQLLGLLATFDDSFVDAVREEYETNPALAGYTDAQIDEMMDMVLPMAIGMTIFFMVVGVGLFLLVIMGLRRKKDWARVTGIVFAIIGAVFSILGALYQMTGMMATMAGMLSMVLMLAYIGLTIAWLVMAFNRNVRDYLSWFKR